MRYVVPAVMLLGFSTLLAQPSAAQSPDELPATPVSPFAGRTGATKELLLKQFGGTKESEAAVARALAWLAKQQRQDGSWIYDGTDKDETAASTGMGVLAFLGAGHGPKLGKYAKVVKGGADWLVKNQQATGKFLGAKNMYAQAIGALALVECYGMTKDRAYQRPAQAAINYIQKGQGADGSWGYQAGTNGDTSIVGWQVQALKAAQLAGDLVVDAKVLAKAVAFLDKVGGPKKATYGYTTAPGAPGTSLTAIGLWCRATVDNWTADNEAVVGGAEGMLARAPRSGRPLTETYFYYYATPLVRYVGGETWAKWNEGPEADGKRTGGLRDALVGSQVTKDGPNLGSWDPDAGFIGRHCGRLGTTALSVLMLEVYYRYPPPAPKPEKK